MADYLDWWEVLLELVVQSHDDPRESVLYKLIVEKYPIQFMQKLLSTAADEYLSSEKRVRATIIIFNMHEYYHLLEENSSKIDAQAMESLRRNAMRLMLDNERDSHPQICGQETVFRILLLSLESDRRWDEYLEFAEEGFTGDSPVLLDIFLMILSALPSHLRHKLMADMKPFIMRNSAQFEAAVVQRLHEEDEDNYPFQILPSIIHIFNQTIPPTFTQAVIMSQFFSHASNYEMLRVAPILEYCIEHTSPFQLSDAANQRMVEIIFRLGLAMRRQQSMAYAAENMAAATRLLNAFLKKHDESVVIVIVVVVVDISEVEE